MKTITLETAELLDVLPEEDIFMVNALIKKLVKAWDPDFTKVTALEKSLLDKADEEMRNGEYVTESEVWS